MIMTVSVDSRTVHLNCILYVVNISYNILKNVVSDVNVY